MYSSYGSSSPVEQTRDPMTALRAYVSPLKVITGLQASGSRSTSSLRCHSTGRRNASGSWRKRAQYRALTVFRWS
jgi:hypothetical protein